MDLQTLLRRYLETRATALLYISHSCNRSYWAWYLWCRVTVPFALHGLRGRRLHHLGRHAHSDPDCHELCGGVFHSLWHRKHACHDFLSTELGRVHPILHRFMDQRGASWVGFRHGCVFDLCGLVPGTSVALEGPDVQALELDEELSFIGGRGNRVRRVGRDMRPITGPYCVS